LELRTLEIAKDFPGFVYYYEECVKRFLGFCTKKEMKRWAWDLRDEATRNKLIDAGFVLKVREKP